MVEGRQAIPNAFPSRGGGGTRGFLFSDLRGYTTFVEQHGASAAADLLDRYRSLVRAAVAERRGAEIRTEGDSFYVVFPSVSDAVLCGLDIVIAAREAPDDSAPPIRVGVGVHAGETLETAEGYVGHQINLAARLCAIAPVGQVIVSDTVRALTQSVMPVQFVSRGRRRLKGISEPVHIYAAQLGETTAAPRRRVTPVARGLIAAVPVAALGIAALVWFAQQAPATTPPRDWKIGLSLPRTGESEFADALRRAVDLALEEANAADPAGPDIALVALDDAGGSTGEDLERAKANAIAFVGDPDVIAMIGPLTSQTAAEQIPITNEAGLLHCSSTNTDPRLTKPRAGALDLRSAAPLRINYVRLPAAADIEGSAGASFAFRDLGARHTLIIHDVGDVGPVVAEAFEQAFDELGGALTRRALNPGSDPVDILAPLDAGASAPDLVFFGGFTSTGAVDVRRAMVSAGHADVPFLGWDGLWDGAGDVEGSFIDGAGDAAVGSYLSHPTVGTISRGFEDRYRDRYGAAPAAQIFEFTAASHACVEVILQSLTAVLASDPRPEAVREAVRAYAVDPANRFETVVGDVGFDANGDTLRQIVSFFRVEPDAAGGAGDWLLVKQQDFGPAT